MSARSLLIACVLLVGCETGDTLIAPGSQIDAWSLLDTHDGEELLDGALRATLAHPVPDSCRVRMGGGEGGEWVEPRPLEGRRYLLSRPFPAPSLLTDGAEPVVALGDSLVAGVARLAEDCVSVGTLETTWLAAWREDVGGDPQPTGGAAPGVILGAGAPVTVLADDGEVAEVELRTQHFTAWGEVRSDELARHHFAEDPPGMPPDLEWAHFPPDTEVLDLPRGTPFARLRGMQSGWRFSLPEATPLLRMEEREGFTRIQAIDPETRARLHGWVSTEAIQRSNAPSRRMFCGTGLFWELVTAGLWLHDAPYGEPVARSFRTFDQLGGGFVDAETGWVSVPFDSAVGEVRLWFDPEDRRLTP